MIDDWKENHRGFQAHKKTKPQQQQQQQQQQQRVTITQKDWDKIDAILGNDQIRSRLFDAGYVIVRR
ncbi:MAG: hypothetical protein WCE74_04475 [Pseudolabrys sp.]